MKERSLAPAALDVAALCKQGGRLHGLWPLAQMARLAESFCAAPDGSASWSAVGAARPVAGGEAELWLQLQAKAEVPLQCQRCLQLMTEPLAVDRRFRFVRSEDEAAALDEESDDDVLALPARLDLLALLEDELILALPIVPRHAVCPEPLPLPAEEPDEEPAPHPFAALAGLRGKPGSQD
jgi:uncharacterized protein